MLKASEYGYAARHPVCGHFRAAGADDPVCAKEVSKLVAEDGLIVERLTLEAIRAANWGRCAVCDPKVKPARTGDEPNRAGE